MSGSNQGYQYQPYLNAPNPPLAVVPVYNFNQYHTGLVWSNFLWFEADRNQNFRLLDAHDLYSFAWLCTSLGFLCSNFRADDTAEANAAADHIATIMQHVTEQRKNHQEIFPARSGLTFSGELVKNLFKAFSDRHNHNQKSAVFQAIGWYKGLGTLQESLPARPDYQSACVLFPIKHAISSYYRSHANSLPKGFPDILKVDMRPEVTKFVDLH